MKKTLIALAAVAVTGAAFAQSSVTISGKYGFAFQKGQGGTANMATTDGDVRFTAVEDLGGGLKATAALELRVRGRESADDGVSTSTTALPVAASRDGVGGRNATVGLSGGFGSVTLGSVEAGNGIIGRGFAGAPVSLATGYDGAILSGPANVDWFKYTSPELAKGLTVSYQRVDSIGDPGDTQGTTGDVFGLDYAAGPLSAGIDYTTFSNDRTVTTAGLYAAGTVQGKSRTRLSASYDFGMAAVGFGYEKNSGIAAQYALGVKVPMGAVTLGAIYANNSENDNKGWGIGADYAFSKRTVLNVSYGDETTTGVDGDQYRIRLMHSF